MSNTFQDAVLQIKNQVDILEIVSNEVILKKRGSNYWGLCPFHGEKLHLFPLIRREVVSNASDAVLVGIVLPF